MLYNTRSLEWGEMKLKDWEEHFKHKNQPFDMQWLRVNVLLTKLLISFIGQTTRVLEGLICVCLHAKDKKTPHLTMLLCGKTRSGHLLRAWILRFVSPDFPQENASSQLIWTKCINQSGRINRCWHLGICDVLNLKKKHFSAQPYVKDMQSMHLLGTPLPQDFKDKVAIRRKCKFQWCSFPFGIDLYCPVLFSLSVSVPVFHLWLI